MDNFSLLPLLTASIFINIFLFASQKKFQNIFKSLLSEIKGLQNLLSNSTGNIDKIIQENKNLLNQVESLKKNKEKLLTIKTGDKVICGESLTGGSNDFEVLYECHVMEATEQKLKLNAFDFKSNDDWANKNRQSVISFYQDKWTNRDKCEIIIDKQHIRDSKLDDLIN
jgi:hypothetical protein